MQDAHEALCYHGRRSVDELVGAMKAADVTVARAHKALSLMHLDRFVAMVTATADSLRHEEPNR